MKKKVTRFLSMSLALMSLMTVLCFGASAEEIVPMYDGELDISTSGRADCYGYVRTRTGYSVDFTMELLRDGRTIKSWSDSGSGIISISEPYYVTPDHDYQVVVSADVYNSQGRLVDTPSTESIVISY